MAKALRAAWIVAAFIGAGSAAGSPPAGPPPRSITAEPAARTDTLAISPGPAPAPSATSTVPAPVSAMHFVERPDSELVLLAIQIETTPTGVVVAAYRGRKGWLIPLGELARALEFAIDMDPERGRAQGWILDKRRRFQLDGPARTGFCDVIHVELDSSDVEFQGDDLYVSTAALSLLLPLDLSVDEHAAMLTVVPREPLPVQRRKQREAKREQLVALHPPEPRPSDWIRVPYRALDWPAVDASLGMFRDTGPFVPGTALRYTAVASGDMLFAESHTFLAGDDVSGVRTARLTLGRSDPEPVLLGPLHARAFEAGEVFDPGVDLLTLAAGGPGVRVTSFSPEAASEYDRLALQGELLPGWDAELYVDDALIAYQEATTSGRYRFVEIPLRYGVNQLRLEFYGPQGQRRTESRVIRLGESLTAPGRFEYRAIAFDPERGGVRTNAEISAGIAKRLAAAVQVASAGLADGGHLYTGAGLRWSRQGVFARADALTDTAGGNALQMALATQIGPIDLEARGAFLDGFRSEVLIPAFGPIRNRSALRTRGLLGRGSRHPLGLGLEWQRDAIDHGGAAHTLTGSVTTTIGRCGLSNRLQSVVPPAAWAARRTDGTLLVSQSMRGLVLRGGLDYRFEAGFSARDLSLTAETWRAGGLGLQAGIHGGSATGALGGHLGLLDARGRVGVSLRSEYAERTGGSVSLVLTCGLTRDERTGRWLSQARPNAEQGGVSARVFLDQNANGRLDPGEPPLAGVLLHSDGAREDARSDSTGVALLRGLPGDRGNRVRIVSESLEDPLWIASREEIAVVPRVGRTLYVDSPVLSCGEVTGTLSLMRDGALRTAAGVPLEIVDPVTGRVFERTHSAYDGFYDVPRIPPGRWLLRVPQDWLDRARLKMGPMAFEVGSSATVLEAQDVTLERSSTPAAEAREP